MAAELLIGVYVLADIMMMPSLKNAWVDCLVADLKLRGVGQCFHPDILMLLRRKDYADSKLCRLGLRSCIWTYVTHPGAQGQWKGMYDHDETDLLLELLDGIREFLVKPWGHVCDDSPCTYHDHVEGETCEA